MIEVHNFNVWDNQEGKLTSPARKSPRERILAVAGEIIPRTNEMVDENDLDDQGRYDPNRKKPGTV